MTTTTTTVDQVLENINDALAKGFTVRIASVYKYSDVTSKTVDKFRKAGYELFKVSNGCLFMRRGKNWDCIQSEVGGNSVKITAY